MRHISNKSHASRASTKKRKTRNSTRAQEAQDELDQLLPIFDTLSLRIGELERTIDEENRDYSDYLVGDRVVVIDRNTYQYGLEGVVERKSTCYVWIRLRTPFQGKRVLQKSKQLITHHHLFET